MFPGREWEAPTLGRQAASRDLLSPPGADTVRVVAQVGGAKAQEVACPHPEVPGGRPASTLRPRIPVAASQAGLLPRCLCLLESAF